MRMKSVKTVCAGLLLTLSVCGISGCGIGKTKVVVNSGFQGEEVFEINGEISTLPQAKVFLTNYQNLYATMYGVDLWNKDLGDCDLETYVKNLTLSQMAQIMTMDFLAEEKGIKLGEEEKSKIKEAAQEYYLSLNEEEKQYMCVNQGDIEKLYTRYGLANKLYTSLTGAINAEVSDDDARVMEAMQIYVTEERVADEIQNQLSQGGDFVSLAGLYSEVEERTITFGRENVSKELAEVAFQLEDQQTSGKIAANNGFYFLKCTNHYNQELTDANKSVILENRRKETFEDVYSEYLTTISSKYNEKVWDEVKLKINDKITTDSFFQVYDKYCKW